MNNYKILKIPVSREKSVFYYYKQYEPKKEEGTSDNRLVDLPKERTIYLCHFLRPI